MKYTVNLHSSERNTYYQHDNGYLRQYNRIRAYAEAFVHQTLELIWDL